MAKKNNNTEDQLKNFLPINRDFFAHPFWTEKRPFSKSEAWTDLLMSARFEESQAAELIGGRLVSWTKGQLPASIRFLRDRWNWQSAHKVEDFLKLCEKLGMILKHQDQGQTIITILNYPMANYKGKKAGGQQQGQSRGQQKPHPQSIPLDQGDSIGDADGEIEGTLGGQSGDETKIDKKEKNEEDRGASANQPSPEEKKQFEDFTHWIEKNAPRVKEMKEPFTIDQYLQLKKLFESGQLTKKVVSDTIQKMHNWTPLLQKNVSAYLTLRNWLRMDEEENSKSSITKEKSGTNYNEKIKAAMKKAVV